MLMRELNIYHVYDELMFIDTIDGDETVAEKGQKCENLEFNLTSHNYTKKTKPKT